MKSFEDDQQCLKFNPVFDWKPVKRNECRGYAIIFPQIENTDNLMRLMRKYDKTQMSLYL